VKLNPEAGLTTMEMVDAAEKGAIRAYYIMGENPLMSEPDLRHSRHVMEQLDFVLVQDIFFNETAEYAVGREKSVGFKFANPSEIWEEMADLTPPFQGISHSRLQKEGGVHWPCPTPDHPGTPYLFTDSFPRGKGQLVSLEYEPSVELPDQEYPYILSTGRVLYHWHGGTMTRRSKLDEIYPEPTVELHPEDASHLGIISGEWITVRSRRGAIQVKSIITKRSPQGMVFIPFHFAEAAANELTNDVRDPKAKIPDYKVCAVAIDLHTETNQGAQ
jgi:predicted molibdopterin-dependent oxidoreductase YjgC